MQLQNPFGQYESLQHIFTHQSIATFIIDVHHRIVFWNRACEELTGLKAEQMLGSNEVWRVFSERARPSLADLMVDNQLAEAHEYFSKLRPSNKSPDAWHAEGWSNLPNGRQHYLVSNAHPVVDDNGHMVAVVETLEDITEFIKPPEDLEGGAKLQAIFDNTPASVWLLGPDGKLRFANRAFCATLGVSAERLLEAGHYREVMPHDIAEQFLASDRECLAQDEPHLSRITMPFADGKQHILEITRVKVHENAKLATGVIGIAMDVTECAYTGMKHELAGKVFDNMSEAIIVTDDQNNIVSVNSAFSRITGYSDEEVIGKNPRLLSSGLQSKEFYDQLWNTLLEKGHWHGELWNRRKGGEFYPQQLTIDVIRDESGRVTHHMAVSTDISERINAQERIQYLASHDPLTGLPNRTMLMDRLQQSLNIAERNGQQVAVIFIDLDHFKTINDTLGHATGDKLLCKVAERLRMTIRQIDTVSRLGGDEFVVILPELDGPDGAARVTHTILETMRHPIEFEDFQLHVTPSIGIAMYPRDGKDINDLTKSADNAMYHAKHGGRNTYRFFSSEMNVLVQERFEIETALHNALSRNELDLYYQPQVSSKTGKIVGAEALMRWHHPERGLLMPAEFIGIAENSGLIVPMGRWALEEACRQHVVWRDAGYPLRISVNLSVRQFQLEDLPEMVMGILHASGMEPKYLELEITEGALLDDTVNIAEKLEKLAKLGVTIALDDFGTGYSSLNYLRRYPINILKIDQCFVKNIDTDKTNYAITKTIIDLAQALNISTVAEGVEDAAQELTLQGLGCQTMQGYYNGRPTPADEFISILGKSDV